MNNTEILEELIEIIKSSGVTIRSEPMGGNGGGLCMVNKKMFFFVDTQASAAHTVEICAKAVKKVTDIESIYIKPQIRQLIEKYSQ